jgi:glycosyltransferase involved in cell wall biosynthesis
MKLLIYLSSLSGGGAERVATTLANHWADRGWQVSIATLAGVERDFYMLDPRVERIAFNLVGDGGGVPGRLVANIRRILRLRRTLRRLRPDVALSMMNTANVVLAIASLGIHGVATIGSERIYPPRFPLGRAWEHLRWWTYGYLDAVAAQCDESASWVLSNTRARRAPVIPNPVVLPLPWQPPVVAPTSMGKRGRKRLLAVGRLWAQKGFDLLIGAFAMLAPLFQDWELVIVGEGPLKGELQGLIAAKGLEQQVLLPGRVGNVGDWYGSADLFVLSSEFEGFPNTLVEALAYGVPAVSFDCDTGPRDIIRHGVDGLLVPPGDRAALARAIESLMSDDTLRLRLAGQAVAACERFSIENVAAKWEELFLEVRS